MKFHLGPVPEDPKFHPEDDGWIKVHEPNPVAIQFLAIPVAGAMTVLLLWLTARILPAGLEMPKIPTFTPLTWAALLLIIPVHELLHAVFHPGWGLTEHTMIGIWPSRLVFYAFYQGQVARNAFLVSLLAPIAVLSLLPILLLAVFGLPSLSDPLAAALVMISIVNGAAASGDVISLFVIVSQIPSGGFLRNQGWKSYWRRQAREIPISE